jgi:hypothetical protein
MHNYRIHLSNPKAGTYRLITLMISIINCTAFGFVFFVLGSRFQSKLIDLGFGISIAALLIYVYMMISKKKSSMRIEISFIIAALIWMLTGQVLLGFFLALFALLGFFANRELIIGISKEGVNYPSFPPKLIKWEDISQTILKDNILSIDLKNNNLIQHRLLPADAAKIDEKSFNLFCSQNINIKN